LVPGTQRYGLDSRVLAVRDLFFTGKKLSGSTSYTKGWNSGGLTSHTLSALSERLRTKSHTASTVQVCREPALHEFQEFFVRL
jgi:hypothetical protein